MVCPQLAFSGRLNEIGDNKMVLDNTKTEIFPDFKQSFTSDSEYFIGWLLIRKIHVEVDRWAFAPSS
jgi:hypothetical protein